MIHRPLLTDAPIITSILDDDKYNFHMGNFFFHKYRGSIVTYTYKCRQDGVNFAPIYEDLLQQIAYMGTLKLTQDECDWLLENSYCSQEYIEHLRDVTILDPSSVSTTLHANGGITIKYSGVIELEILREVKLLAVISELFFMHEYRDNYGMVYMYTPEWIAEQIQWLSDNAHPKFRFFEAGGRRRFSKDRHDLIVNALWNGLPKDENGKPKYMMGTSNCYLGKKYGIPTFGTQAHQLYMFMQTVTHPALSQTKALIEWNDFYKGKLNTALSDTLGDRKWENDFTKEFQEMYRAQRQDSGDPYKWGDFRLDSYARHGIDTKPKGFTFGDSLNWVSGNQLTERYSDRIAVDCLIGTFITNTLGSRFPQHKALSQVIKLTWANGLPTCKLGSGEGKDQCEDTAMHMFCKTIAQQY